MADERYTVPGLERGLRLLQLFDRQHTSWSAPDIARELDVPRSTVFRIIQTLELLGFIERSEGVYRLGPAVLRLGLWRGRSSRPCVMTPVTRRSSPPATDVMSCS
jgi:DNA-binding IclR family transcriptional regulator